ncbi:hypothetical protein CASFOL_041127 [Castilleja foliolosa]|uniref:F-box domain-containing protein n=1 Tax=Castilleja foliolosa TaxID=1961234 RepID=A0ABD3BEI3_9LAMI
MVSNRPRVFQLRQALASLKQDQSTVDAYFAKLKLIWDELSNYRPKCACGAPSRLCGFNNEEHVMAFLMGLNESLAGIRDQILLMDPLPSMREVFSLVVQQEKQMSITVSGSLVFAARDALENVVNGATMKTNEEGNSEIHVPKKYVKVINGRSQPYHLRSCKRLNLCESNINSVPDEIVFDILVQIPARDIYGAVRSVCRKWNQMIRTHKFVNTHLHHSTYGLLIQKRVPLSTELTFMSLSRQGRIDLTRLNYEPEHLIWCSSCNGLILECERKNELALYITNPVTMQRFSLTQPVYPLINGLGFRFSAIAYASLSMKYKVVRVNRMSGEQWCFIILTVGVDESWRPVCAQHLSPEAKKNLRFRPLTTEGFVHWAKCGNYVLTLNVETEIITEYRVPSSSGAGVYYFSTAKYLSMLIERGEWSWEIWEMKPETGEWTQLPGIDLKDRMYEIFEGLSERGRIYKSAAFVSSSIFPVGWLEYKEVLLCRVWGPQQHRIRIVWNIQLKELEFVDLDSVSESFLVHRNSLSWLDGC